MQILFEAASVVSDFWLHECFIVMAAAHFLTIFGLAFAYCEHDIFSLTHTRSYAYIYFDSNLYMHTSILILIFDLSQEKTSYQLNCISIV